MANESLGEIELDESPIPETCIRRMDEATIKRDGYVWRIYKNDADPFPSNPHARNIESGLTLDLRNGDLYFQRRPANKRRQKALIGHPKYGGEEGHPSTTNRLTIACRHGK